MSPSMRALLFLYGNANIVGCALALLGPLLLFVGVIDRGWLLITVGLYGAGWLLGHGLSRNPRLERSIEESLSHEETLDHLDRLIRRARPQLTASMNAHLDSLRGSIAEVLPRLPSGGIHDNNRFTVRETVLSYLPETLSNYVALPPMFRSTHPLKDGKTARELMEDQLALLDAKMKEIVANVSAADAQALLANGQFLEAKFRQPDFLAQ